ncbi:hypothetical protein Ct61P_15131 [Colletotrichum tofieldiae]|nr:hypothetical protein Ct61P_15131 [Colletotrichum tofieldiae]
MANATSSGSTVDKAFAARQVFRFRNHLLDKDPTSKKLALLDNVDPGHRYLRHLGWDKAGAGDEEAWRRAWENSPAGVGQFGSWVSGPFKRWRDE